MGNPQLNRRRHLLCEAGKIREHETAGDPAEVLPNECKHENVGSKNGIYVVGVDHTDFLNCCLYEPPIFVAKH